ncbi:Zinc finger, SWIM-type [Niveomyces insectorum RCEF 264]|uniref:Zinc finger, SWIM-type n=1 Tax=Niveomyces insectorum RCEF 264 TaxID=1081102 RepID=A0A168AAK2_9HYPO|nr:Zinc finger, SWIM-type [Niveomyces insectorum RCEF 264]
MAPVTRSRAHPSEGRTGAAVGGPVLSVPTEHRSPHRAEGGTNSNQDSGSGDEDDEEDEGPVRSPLTNLFYTVDNLDDETEELVRELFRPQASEETPPMVIEWCGISNDPDVYAFQLREIVPRTIRIGSATSRIPQPSCNCTGSANTPCRHLIWLIDQIAKQTLGNHPPDQPLVLDHNAFPQALGDAYTRIADFHIDVLANTLHCSARPPNGRPNVHRVREAREILAGLAGVRDDVHVDTYAPEIFDVESAALQDLLWKSGERWRNNNEDDEEEEEGEEKKDSDEHMSSDDEGSDDGDGPGSGGQGHRPRSTQGRRGGGGGHGNGGRSLLERGDLQLTVLRLLVSNDEFFAMFLKLLAPYDKARDPYRKIQQRVEYVLEVLLAGQGAVRAGAVTEPGEGAGGEGGGGGGEVPEDTLSETTTRTSNTETVVAWTARHVENAVEQIRLLLQQQIPRPPAAWARRSAGRALVWIFHALVFQHNRDVPVHAGATQDDRNLYQRLIGNNNNNNSEGGFFLLDALQLLVDQVHFRTQLERIRQRIQVNGYREPYMRKLDEILAQMREAAARPRGGGSDSGNRRRRHGDDDDDDDDNENPLDPPSRGPVGGGGGGSRSGRMIGVSVPAGAGSKRQGSGTGRSSDRATKRMR